MVFHAFDLLKKLAQTHKSDYAHPMKTLVGLTLLVPCFALRAADHEGPTGSL